MASELTPLIEEAIRESVSVKQAVLADKALLEKIAAVAQEFVKAYRGGGKILLFGNGGSAADAQHIAAEFVGRFLKERRPLPAIALTTNTSAVTGIGNDYLYENVFARQVEAFGSKGDVAVGISTSGKSPNVLKGLAVARRLGLITVGWCGAYDEAMAKCADYCLAVPSRATPRIQESHILIGHVISDLTERALFSK